MPQKRKRCPVETDESQPPVRRGRSREPGPSGISMVRRQHRQGVERDAESTSLRTRGASPGAAVEPADVEDNESQRIHAYHHNTPRLVRSTDFSNTQAATDTATRLSEAIERTLQTVRESAMGGGNPHFVNRLTTAKSLPVFSGDPIEWLHFKGAYELTTQLGNFSERENIARLFNALKGDAREAVSGLLATNGGAKEIMQTLDLLYGNKNVVAEKISKEIKNLPYLDAGKMNLTQFAIKLKGAVAAFKSLEAIGHLHSVELIKSVVSKLPPALTYAFNRYAATAPPEKTVLEKITDFIYKEAELAASVGILDLAPSSANTESSLRTSTRKSRCTFLKILPVRVSGPTSKRDTYALLDEGSTITLIDKKLTRSIGGKGPKINLALKGVNDRELVVSSSEKINVTVQGAFDSYDINHALTVQNLNLPHQSLPECLVKLVSETEHINLEAYEKVRPQILLGQDNWRLIVTREFRGVRGHDLAISRTLLGWVMHGTTKLCTEFKRKVSVCFVNSDEEMNSEERESCKKLSDLVKLYFQLDDFGVRVDTKPRNIHDHAQGTLEETSRYTGNVWETGLLWKSNCILNINSFATARKRLFSLEKRLDRDPSYAKLYYQEMNRFIRDGYAEKIEKKNVEAKRVWYLPHFGVQRPSKPGKLRLVFDAAAKTAGYCLNDQLETGPDLLQPLPGVLLRFCQYAVACKADIKDMFLRVKIRKEDRDAQRFLWRGSDRTKEPEVYAMTSLIFGAKSSPSSAMYIKNRNAKEYSYSKPDATKSIIKNSYMDDYLISRKSTQETINLARDVIKINARANFEMYGWTSNDNTVARTLSGVESTGNREETRLCERGGEKVLGLYWDTKTDELCFKVDMEKIPTEVTRGLRKPTKREYLRIIMSIFDPLGLLIPFTTKSKLLMQKVWRSGIGWDNPLRDEENENWRTWLQTLNDIRESRIPRCLIPTSYVHSKAQLHVFCDASLEAYAAAAYIRLEIENGPANVKLIMAKSRVAPLKPLSVPRLELQAALLGSRLAKTITEELDIKFQQRYLWSDSITVIRWIKGEPRTRQVFVAQRLGEIDEITEGSEWRWVPSGQNPADHATRWSSNTPGAITRWHVGPEYLQKPEIQWPIEKPLNEVSKKTIDEMELRKTFVYTVDLQPSFEFPLLIRILGWQGLLVIARRVQAAVDQWRGKSRTGMTVDNIANAERYWFRVIQAEHFGKEIAAIEKGKDVPKASKLASLKPYLDEDRILRASGRAVNIHEVEFNNYPIILDGKHIATKMLVKEYHRRYYHASNNTVVNELRQMFYIIGLRKILRSVAHRCVTCRLHRARPQPPVMSTLPTGRLAYRQRPFSQCGIDYFGPMFVKIGRRREKRWGVLFTCLTTRAIHIELACSLNASSAIMALQRLAARRGTPTIVYSDNGTNFKGASREIKEAIAKIDKEKQQEYALARKIKWVFNPPDAPHMGGVWERLIRSVKTALHVVLREQAPTEETLHTLLTEIEHTVNSRPLTHVSVDPRDKEALTPNHFLIGTSSGNLRLGRYEAHDTCLRKQWRTAQHFADAFWKRWLREYLPCIINRPKWTEKRDPLKQGDLVLIIDMLAPRNEWKKGTITDVFPGSDGGVRVVKVHTPWGIFTRPTHKLIKLLSIDEVQNP
ncbi:uncharacterized protein LOC143208473 [Lasioglossum baleicum]|uniref:uncharacterized protein LOC143208473 n=1 Tax=Lasioglossum baleicum TaxID=434251 RepID=UPI003FCE48AF